MNRQHFADPRHAIIFALDELKMRGVTVDAGRWQGVPTEGKPDLVTKEILDLSVAFAMPRTMEDAILSIKPNIPWAEEHFQERVSRDPSNPGKQYLNWPWWQGQDAKAMDDSGHELVFSHTYQERFWSKQAGIEPLGEQHVGIRYRYGDLDDVVDLLFDEPMTRQAYLPIFFPEDTGVTHGGRVPCTLGYHFLLRYDLLHCWYDIRSCDAVRHFCDDLYLATRLVQWVLAELREKSRFKSKEGTSGYNQPWGSVTPGTLFFTAHSFHVHMGDHHRLAWI